MFLKFISHSSLKIKQSPITVVVSYEEYGETQCVRSVLMEHLINHFAESVPVEYQLAHTGCIIRKVRLNYLENLGVFFSRHLCNKIKSFIDITNRQSFLKRFENIYWVRPI